MKKVIILTLLSASLISCGGSGSKQNNNPSEQNPSSTAQQQKQIAQDYVAEILQIMKDNVITKYDVDWGQLETEVNALAANASNIEETYPALTTALRLLNTNHSLLLSRSGTTVASYSELNCNQHINILPHQLENIGYIRVNGFTSNDKTQEIEFAKTIQNKIAEQDSTTIEGWIVDLRVNHGGNMWPMIAGLGPLLGDGIHGYFVNADEDYTSWGYENGSSVLGEHPVTTVEDHYTLLNPSPKIAVLSSREVASSGEASLIAFKKKHNVRFFGDHTCGLSTGNQAFKLKDNSTLILTTSIMTDSEQVKYGGRVLVDQKEQDSEVLKKATEWIKN